MVPSDDGQQSPESPLHFGLAEQDLFFSPLSQQNRSTPKDVGQQAPSKLSHCVLDRHKSSAPSRGGSSSLTRKVGPPVAVATGAGVIAVTGTGVIAVSGAGVLTATGADEAGASVIGAGVVEATGSGVIGVATGDEVVLVDPTLQPHGSKMRLGSIGQNCSSMNPSRPAS